MENVEAGVHQRLRTSPKLVDVAFAAIGALLCLGLVGYLSMDLSLPVRTAGDHLFMLVQIKKIVLGSGWRMEPHLGFPGVQDQMLFPLFDTSFRFISEIIAKFTSNIFLIDNLTYVVGIALIYVFSYYAFRTIGVRSWIALVGGVAFTVSMFLSYRSYGHDYLALYYSVPLGAVMSLMLARNTLFSPAKLLLSGTSILALIVVSTSGLYYAFFTAMFLLITACAKAVADRRLAPIVFALLFSGILLLLLLLAGYGTAIVDLARGNLPAVGREPVEQIVYALFMGTGLHVFADAGLWTARFTHYDQILTTIIGQQLLEWPGIAITLVILSAPVLAFILNAMPRRSTVSTPRLDLVILCMMLITIGIVFAASGGLGFVFNFVVTPVIRAQARILPFLAFFGTVIIVIGLQYFSELRNVAIRYTLCGVASIALIACNIPAFGSAQLKQTGYLASSSYASLQTISAMLAKKDAAGLQTVLQLPHAGWPELANVGNFALYNHQLPYLLDRLDSSTKWSYGLMQSQPEFIRVAEKLDLENLPIDLVDRALELGFDAILIERAAFSPEEFAAIEQRIDASPRSCRISDDAERVLFSLGDGACAAG